MKVETVSAALVVLGIVTVGFGQSADSWVGQKVVVSSPSTVLKIGRDVVATGAEYRVFRVERVQGPWLWVVAHDVRGWVKPGQVIPIDRALDQYNREIQSNPGAFWAYGDRGNLW